MESTLKISLKQIRSIIKESLLTEEESDYYRDYRAGTISRREYDQLVNRFQGGSKSSRDKMRPSDYALGPVQKSTSIDAAKEKIRTALKDAGLVDDLRDYSGKRAYLTKGYKDHPEYESIWDTAASELLRSLERQLG